MKNNTSMATHCRILIQLLLLPTLLFTPSSIIFAQHPLDEYKASNGVTYHPGDSIVLGKGSNPGSGEFVFVQMRVLGSTKPANRYAAGLPLLIKKIKHPKITGLIDKVIFVCNGQKGGMVEYLVQIDEAIDKGEVKENKETSAAKTETSSVADEIKKLKELRDQGAITDDEYKEQKKKLLSKE